MTESLTVEESTFSSAASNENAPHYTGICKAGATNTPQAKAIERYKM